MNTAARVTRKITIFRDDVYAGVGKLDQGTIVDCDAQLGHDTDASEETYELIEDAIDEGEESVERPDGTYTWIVETVRAGLRDTLRLF